MARKTTKRPARKTPARTPKAATTVSDRVKSDRLAGFPALGRAMLWVDRPGSAERIFYGLAVICGLLFLLDFTYEKYGHFDVERLPGFFGIYGFVMFTALILAAKALRMVIRRPEDFYADKAVDREDYPDAGLDKVDHHG